MPRSNLRNRSDESPVPTPEPDQIQTEPENPEPDQTGGETSEPTPEVTPDGGEAPLTPPPGGTAAQNESKEKRRYVRRSRRDVAQGELDSAQARVDQYLKRVNAAKEMLGKYQPLLEEAQAEVKFWSEHPSLKDDQSADDDNPDGSAGPDDNPDGSESEAA